MIANIVCHTSLDSAERVLVTPANTSMPGTHVLATGTMFHFD